MKTGSESSFSPLQSGFYPPPQAFPKQLSAASLRTRTGPAAAGSVRSSLRPAPRLLAAAGFLAAPPSRVPARPASGSPTCLLRLRDRRRLLLSHLGSKRGVCKTTPRGDLNRVLEHRQPSLKKYLRVICPCPPLWPGEAAACQVRGVTGKGTVTRDRHAAPPRGGPSPRRAQAVAGAVFPRLPFCSKRTVKFHAPSCSPTHFPAPRFPGTWHSLGPGAALQSGSRKGVGAPRTSLTGSPPPAARAWRSRGVSEPSQRLGVRRSRPSSSPG